MRQLRTLFLAFAFVASLVALAQHLGLDLWGCASCSMVRELPISSMLAWGGPVALAILAFGAYKDLPWAKIASIVAAAGSLGLIGWMVNHRTVCATCALVHAGVIASALCLVPKAKFLGPAVFSLLVVFTATNGWDRFTEVRGVGIFRPRDNETIPDGKVFVLFTDPECSRCRIAEAEIAKLPNRPHLLYRWTLLPQSLYRSIRAATLLEMTRQNSPKLFVPFLEEVGRLPLPLTDSALKEAAIRVGLASAVDGWLANPSESVSIALEADRTTSEELEIQSLPALAELSRPDASGVRTLRLVPFSSIGLK